MSRALVVGVLTCMARTTAGAQADSTRAARDAGAVPKWAWGQCMLGLTYGQPMKLALAYGGGLVHESMTGGADTCVFGAAKVGFGGARGTIGVGRSWGTLGGGVALSGGVLRTFNGAWGATAQRTYVGGGLSLWPLLALGGEIGYYVRLGDEPGASDRQRRIITWSTGFGF